jgi:hypothetical protein
MANARRGEISAVLDGRERTLCLTLGSLAELETAFGASDLGDLSERFGAGRLSARDLIRIVAAGLRGAGEAVSDDDVASMRADGGAIGFAEIAVRLLTVTFGASTRDEGEGGADAARPTTGERQTRVSP